MITLMIFPTGNKHWRRNNKLHRANGPAMVRIKIFNTWSTIRYRWIVDGKYHNLNGPAVVFADNTGEFWINGQQVSEYEHMFIITVGTNNDQQH